MIILDDLWNILDIGIILSNNYIRIILNILDENIFLYQKDYIRIVEDFSGLY